MFTQIRKHQKWLWICISALVIISFVWYFNPNQQVGGGGGAYDNNQVGMIGGEPVTRMQYTDAYREAVLHYLFSYGEWPSDNEMTRQMRPVERETRNRLFLVRKMKEHNIRVSDQAVVDWITQAFQDRETKQYHHEFYQRFIQNLEQRRMKEADFQRYARHQVGISHLAAIAGAPGKLVTPQEAERAYRREHEKADVKLAVFSLSNYVANVQLTDEAIARFYTNRQGAYRLPERVQLAYVEFPASNYLAQAEEKLAGETNLSQRIDMVYLQRGPSFFTDVFGQPLAADAAKARIREDMKKEIAMSEARREAFAFATELDAAQVPVNPADPAEGLEKFAASKGREARVTEPFSQTQPPPGLDLPEQFNRLAFSLTPEEPVVPEPVPGDDALYLFAFKRRIPSELPDFETIRERVTQDYKRSETLTLARLSAQAFLAAVTNSPAKGEQFVSMAEQSGIMVVDLPPFSKDPRSPVEGLPPQVNSGSLRNTAFELPEGGTSGYLPGADGGYIVYVEKFIPASDEEVRSGLAQFTQELQRRSAAEAFNEWFAHEMQLAKVQLPGDQMPGEEMP